MPSNLDALVVFVDAQFRQIAAVLRAMQLGHVDPTFVAPDRPRDGDFRLADGVHWQPGAGQGPYMYYAGAWHPMGSTAAPTTFRAPLTTTAPASPTIGDIALADGVGWKPNGTGGFGVWFYNGSSWTQMG